jgi:hypothetical protein
MRLRENNTGGGSVTQVEEKGEYFLGYFFLLIILYTKRTGFFRGDS